MYVPSFFWFFSLGECSGATAYSRRPPRPDRRHRHHVQQKVQSLERQASALPRCDRPNREARPGPGEPRHGMGAESRRRGFLLSWPAATLHGAGAREKPAPGSRGGPAFTRRKCMWLAGAAAYGHGRVGDWSCPVGRTRVTGTAGLGSRVCSGREFGQGDQATAQRVYPPSICCEILAMPRNTGIETAKK
jgi:hypothetical protein